MSPRTDGYSETATSSQSHSRNHLVFSFRLNNHIRVAARYSAVPHLSPGIFVLGIPAPKGFQTGTDFSDLDERHVRPPWTSRYVGGLRWMCPMHLCAN